MMVVVPNHAGTGKVQTTFTIVLWILLQGMESQSIQHLQMNNGGRTMSLSTNNENDKNRITASPSILNNVWFEDTLDVTVQPRLTWSPKRRMSPPPHASVNENKYSYKDQGDTDIHLMITLTIDNHSLILDLHPNRDLLGESYRETNTGAGKGYDDKLPTERQIKEQCEYQGVVTGYEETWVALSTCDGLSGVVFLHLGGGRGDVEILVEPSPNSTLPHHPHRIFSSRIIKLPGSVCGVTPRQNVDGGHFINDSTEAETNTSSALLHNRTRRYVGPVGNAVWYERSTMFVEAVVIADSSFYKTYGTRTATRCKSIINIVNSLYRYLGIVVVLSYLEVWEDADKMDVTSNYSNNLKLLSKYRLKMLERKPNYNNDNTILITTVEFDGDTLGFATVSGMCGKGESVAVVQDKPESVGIVGYIFTHEMGHNFGMKHDENGMNGQNCHCDTPACIMKGEISTNYEPSVLWSSCSKQVIKDRIDSQDFKCLRNVPKRMYPRASCGDGVVDEGEECDCGVREFCHNSCCNATTCRFAGNAACASGPCCDTKRCDFKPRGEMCRESVSECDLPEFCPGDSEMCPSDVSKADGTPCLNGLGYCSEAECGSHLGMCHTLWGDHADVAHEDCYTTLNTRGGSNGNCGFKTHQQTDLKPCDAKDKLCGSIQCIANKDDKPQVRESVSYAIYSISNNECFYIVSTNYTPSWYWLTPDGAKCGEGKMCLKQRCVSVPEPSSHCRGGCSGRGVCNSNNHCHCEKGFAPPYCSQPGDGGSLDSHTTRRIRYVEPLWEALFILSLIALGVLVIMCCLWDQIHKWWERKGRVGTPSMCVPCLDQCWCPLVSLVTLALCGGRGDKQDQLAQDPAERDTMVRSRHQSTEERAAYMQSISVDSGCISDVEEASVVKPGSYNSRVSMRSLVNVFMRFGSGTPASPAPSDHTDPSPLSRMPERQQPVPLHRFVVDPLACSRRSRHGTPPPPSVLKEEYRRSFSLNERSNSTTSCPPVAPPPPSPQPKSPHATSRGVVVMPNQCGTPSDDQHNIPIKLPSASPYKRKRTPMMPPGMKNKTLTSATGWSVKQEGAAAAAAAATQEAGDTGAQTHTTTPLKRPLLPPATLSKPPNTLSESCKPRVKDLARIMEKQ